VSETFDHIVVGAGMSGLAHALHAQRRGARVLLLEAGERGRGVIATRSTEGYRHERAATSVPSGSAHLLGLLAGLRGDDVLVPGSGAAKAQFLLGPHGLVAMPRSPASLLKNPLLPARTTIRALGELFRGRRRGNGGETLVRFVQRRFGRGVAEAFLRPFTSGIYGAAPERLGAADAFPKLVAMERRRGGVLRGLMAGRTGGPRSILMPRDGMASVMRALADALGDALRLETPVASIQPGTRDAPAHVRTADGETFAADELTLAVRAPAQATLLAKAYPHVADTLRAVDYVPMIVVAIGFRCEDGPAVPEGFGFLRGAGSKARILGATFNSKLNPATAPEGCELLTAFVGGSEDRAALDLDDGTLRRIVLRDLEHALGGTIQPAMVHLTRWRQAIPLFAPGHRGRMAGASAALGAGRLRLLGSHMTGVSLNDCCRPSAPIAGPLPAGLTRV